MGPNLISPESATKIASVAQKEIKLNRRLSHMTYSKKHETQFELLGSLGVKQKPKHDLKTKRSNIYSPLARDGSWRARK